MEVRTIQHSTLTILHSTFVSSPNPFPYRVPEIRPILPHLVAANVSRMDDAGERLSRVWRHLMAVLHVLGPDDETRLGIEDDDVRIVAGGKPSFAVAEARQPRRAGG